MNQRFGRHNPVLLALSVAGALGASSAAQAQIQEVLVTAQRTPTLEAKTPVALSVLSGDQLRDAGISTPAEIGARLPNVYLEGAPDGLRITIRGVSNSDTTEKGDPSAAFMMDGIYIARPQQQTLGWYDLDRIEVLRGPQGTLYGRNSTAGVVNVISHAPTRQFEGSVSSELGDYASRQLDAMLNLPLSPALAVRAAIHSNQRNGYLINGQGTGQQLGTDRNELSARLSALFQLSPTATLLLRVDHSRSHDHGDVIVPDSNFYQGIEQGQPRWIGASTDTLLTNRFQPPNSRPEQGFDRKRSTGLGADLSWQLGPATLYYLGAHRQFDSDFLVNFHYRVAPGLALGVRDNFRGSYAQDSHELRLASNGDGRFSGQVGLYYFHERSHDDYTFRGLELLGLPPYYGFPIGPTVARSQAVFGQGSYRVTPKLRATAGLRYTSDDKSRYGSTNFQQGPVFNPATDFKLLNAAALTTHKTTWRLGLDYDLDPATLLYAAIATGYKSGGFNDGCLAGAQLLGIGCPPALAVPAATLFYQPETLTSQELGLKTRFWHNRASLNLAAFHYDYKNLQLSSVALVQGAPRYVTTNAGVASVQGLELDGSINPSPRDRLTYALTLLDAHYVSYLPDGLHSWAGNKLDRAPSHTLTLAYQHRFALAHGQLSAGVEARRSAAYIIAVPTQQLQYPIPARTQTDAILTFQHSSGAWSLQARVKNLENRVTPITIDSFGMLVPSMPRSAALRLDYRY